MSMKRPTSADVAVLAGVSRTTVSFVLNGREDIAIPSVTRKRVLDAAASLGYTPHGPARQLAQGSTHRLGLVLRQSPEQVGGDALLVDTLHGVVEAARSSGYRVLVESLAPGVGSYASLLKAHHADGLIVSGPRSDDRELHDLVREGYPVVLQGELDGFAGPSVDVDNRAGALLAVRHLLSLGHRRIACITNGPVAYTAAAARLAGYRQALSEVDISADPALEAEADFDPASGHSAILRILDRAGKPPEAVFVASDVVALGVLGGLRERGLRVPADVSLVGFDDISLAAYVDPGLTTIRVPARQLGRAAGAALIERIAGRSVDLRTLLPTELIVRESAQPRAVPVGERARTISATHARAP